MSNEQRTWRDEAMDESLRGFGYGENQEALLHGIRRFQPDIHTYLVWSDRQRTLDFLQTQCKNVESVLEAKHFVYWDEIMVPNISWYTFEWQGHRLEIALVVGHSESATYCLGNEEKILGDFSRCLVKFSEYPAGRALRYTEGWENAPDLDAEIGKVSWDDIVLQSDLLQKVRESVETFSTLKETIHSFGFAWKRGILLVGPPGTGKTMICKAAATASSQYPFLYVRDLRERNKKESIQSIFKRARKLAPCILAMEDLDSLITAENRTVFLNEMDGFASNEGLLIIASSNHPGKIDEALLRRPSRFDRVFHIGLPEIEERREFCLRLLTRDALAEKVTPDLNVAKLCDDVAQKTEGFTPAYLKEAFVSAALSRAQNGATALDKEFGKAVLEQVAELKAHLKKTKNPDSMAEMRSGDDSIGFRR